jgi:hypothetical protein
MENLTAGKTPEIEGAPAAKRGARERTRKLISIAHPKFRDGLTRQASEMGICKHAGCAGLSARRFAPCQHAAPFGLAVGFFGFLGV